MDTLPGFLLGTGVFAFVAVATKLFNKKVDKELEQLKLSSDLYDSITGCHCANCQGLKWLH